MKNWNLLLAALVAGFSTLAQSPQIKWGEEFKMKKGSTDLEVVYSDKSGVYLQEGHMAVKGYFVIDVTARTSATLVKLDKNLSEIYRNDFNKELKGKEFVQFFVLQDKMYLFASTYNKREKILDVYGAEVNKNSGELAGDWVAFTSFQKEEKKDEINYRISYNADSTRIVLVSTIEGREKNEYQVQEFDKSLKAVAKPVTIRNEFDPKTYKLEDVLYTVNKKIILVGRVYEFQEGKKKKEKFLDFANYNIRLYDEKGKQQTEFNTNINGKWLTSTKLLQEKNKDLILAGFYNSSRKEKTIDGMLIQRIDANTGKVLSTSEKQINNSLLSGNMDDDSDEPEDEKESKAERKERERLDKMKDEGEAFSKFMQFRNIFYTSDNGLVILAENYHRYTVTSTHYTPGSNGMPGTTTTSTYLVYECGDLLMCKVNAGGDIGWLQILPKQQREVIQTGYGSGGGFTSLFTQSYFDGSERPFYAGFGAIQANNTIQIFFNDNPKNATVTQAGQKAKMVRRFGKSDCFVLTLDELTGKYKRKMFFTNADVPTSMPRLGSVTGEGMYIVGKDDRTMAKSKIAVAKVTLK